MKHITISYGIYNMTCCMANVICIRMAGHMSRPICSMALNRFRLRISQRATIRCCRRNPEEAPEQLHGYYIKGENFNECSFVWIDDGFKKDTIYIDRNTLFIPDIEFEDGEEICVAQVGDDSIDIGKTEPFIYQAPAE